MSKLLSMALATTLLMSATAQAETVRVDVWADNWFAFYVDDTPIAEDSVPITTERSFNKESFAFRATRPYVLNFITKDFKENDTGLEYIGTRKQQMGDGGLIAQFISDSGQVVAVTNSDWKCLPIHQAPAQKSCEKERSPVAGQGPCGFTEIAEPAGWKTLGFDDSSWPSAVEHSESAVGPKDGYDQVRWNSSAKIIWGSDLETDNTLLCRLVVN